MIEKGEVQASWRKWFIQQNEALPVTSLRDENVKEKMKA